jgi:hypothetical protein
LIGAYRIIFTLFHNRLGHLEAGDATILVLDLDLLGGLCLRDLVDLKFGNLGHPEVLEHLIRPIVVVGLHVLDHLRGYLVEERTFRLLWLWSNLGGLRPCPGCALRSRVVLGKHGVWWHAR